MSSRKFSMVSPAIWRSTRFNSVSMNARFLHLYFITSEHQNSSGCYRIPDAYACADLAWEMPTYLSARQELVEAGLVAFSDETSVVYVCRWFKHCAPTNKSHAIGTQRLIEEIEDPEMRDVVEGEFYEAEKGRTQRPDEKSPPAPEISRNLLNTRILSGTRGY